MHLKVLNITPCSKNAYVLRARHSCCTSMRGLGYCLSQAHSLVSESFTETEAKALMDSAELCWGRSLSLLVLGCGTTLSIASVSDIVHTAGDADTFSKRMSSPSSLERFAAINTKQPSKQRDRQACKSYVRRIL